MRQAFLADTRTDGCAVFAGRVAFVAIMYRLRQIIRMKFDTLLEIVGNAPVFETGLLLAGPVEPGDVRRQLSRWVGAGRLIQLRRGLYAVAPPFRKVQPHPFVVANAMVRASYVSLQAALAYHGLIPEQVAVVTSVTTGRPGRWETPLGSFAFHHVGQSLFFGFERVALRHSQHAFVATAEKALLDLIHLHPGGDQPAYLDELRLQSLENVDLGRLERLAARSVRPKLRRAARYVAALAHAEQGAYTPL